MLDAGWQAGNLSGERQRERDEREREMRERERDQRERQTGERAEWV